MSTTWPSTCPRCGSPRIVRGEYVRGDAIGFAPREVRTFTWHSAVPITDVQAHACSACGLLWSQLDAARLHRTLEKGGTDAALAWLAEKPDWPL